MYLLNLFFNSMFGKFVYASRLCVHLRTELILSRLDFLFLIGSVFFRYFRLLLKLLEGCTCATSPAKERLRRRLSRSVMNSCIAESQVECFH